MIGPCPPKKRGTALSPRTCTCERPRAHGGEVAVFQPGREASPETPHRTLFWEVGCQDLRVYGATGRASGAGGPAWSLRPPSSPCTAPDMLHNPSSRNVGKRLSHVLPWDVSSQNLVAHEDSDHVPVSRPLWSRDLRAGPSSQGGSRGLTRAGGNTPRGSISRLGCWFLLEGLLPRGPTDPPWVSRVSPPHAHCRSGHIQG